MCGPAACWNSRIPSSRPLERGDGASNENIAAAFLRNRNQRCEGACGVRAAAGELHAPPRHPPVISIPIREIFLCAQKNARFWIGRSALVPVIRSFYLLRYLRQHFRRAFPGDEGAEAELCNSYLSRWKSILPGKTAEQMLRLAPLTALFCLCLHPAVGQGQSSESGQGATLFLRSLGRRMQS